MNKFCDYLFHKPRLLLAGIWRRVGRVVPDEPYLKVMFRILMGKKLDLKNPKTFSEKLQWLKLYDRKPEYVKMVDKYATKEYVASIIGEEYIIPTLGVWDKPEEIDFGKMPDQFVMKCTHDSGGVVICKDKSEFDKVAAIKKLNHGLMQDYFKVWREWPYKNVPKRIIAEKYISPEPGVKDLRDYKFFCFNGKVNFFKIDFDRFVEHHANYYDPEGNLLRFGEKAYPPIMNKKLQMPKALSKMIFLAQELSKGIPFLRVDFYDCEGEVFFGELTFFPASGMGKLEPAEWDEQIGKWIELPSRTLA